MSELPPEIFDSLMSRAAELMTHAPGLVEVRRIARIEEVQALREARAVLTSDERHELAKLRLALIERLHGALSADIPVTGAPKGLFSFLLHTAAKNMSQVMRPGAEYEYLVNQAGGPAVLPAPSELLDAAEAWALSHLVADRVDLDLSVLRREWDEAEIAPLNARHK